MPYTELKTKELQKILESAVSRFNLDPAETYLELTWWDNKFLPFVFESCDRQNSEYHLFCGEISCNTYGHCFGKSERNVQVPVGFYIDSHTTYKEFAVRTPLTVKQILTSGTSHDFENVAVYITSDPLNYRVPIDPFKTAVYKNRNGETILALYVDDRDSGEYQPFSAWNPDKHIHFYDDSPESDTIMWAKTHGIAPDTLAGKTLKSMQKTIESLVSARNALVNIDKPDTPPARYKPETILVNHADSLRHLDKMESELGNTSESIGESSGESTPASTPKSSADCSSKY